MRIRLVCNSPSSASSMRRNRRKGISGVDMQSSSLKTMRFKRPPWTSYAHVQRPRVSMHYTLTFCKGQYTDVNRMLSIQMCETLKCSLMSCTIVSRFVRSKRGRREREKRKNRKGKKHVELHEKNRRLARNFRLAPTTGTSFLSRSRAVLREESINRTDVYRLHGILNFIENIEHDPREGWPTDRIELLDLFAVRSIVKWRANCSKSCESFTSSATLRHSVQIRRDVGEMEKNSQPIARHQDSARFPLCGKIKLNEISESDKWRVKWKLGRS